MIGVALLVALASLGSGTAPAPDRLDCAHLTEEAVNEVRARGPAVADDVFGELHRLCPESSRPLSELAGIRFGDHRWRDAESLAHEATRIDPSDQYAWELLGSSRFMLDDLAGALAAWNEIGSPRVTSVNVDGDTRLSPTTLADVSGIDEGRVLTRAAYLRAERRLSHLPGRGASTVRYRPAGGGTGRVEIAFSERPIQPHGTAEWLFAGARAAIDREFVVPIAATRSGLVWTADWRWWTGRPLAGVSVELPRLQPLNGIWRIEASWESQAYAAPANALHESRAHADVSFDQWATANLRYSVAAGFDGWNEDAGASSAAVTSVTRPSHTASLGGRIEQRLLADRLAAIGAFTEWVPLAGGQSFRGGSFTLAARSSVRSEGWVHAFNGSVVTASASAPLALWNGAGEGRARDLLLRAHPLLADGVLSGPAFGRFVTAATAESTRWLKRPLAARLGVALFADAARAAGRLPFTTGAPLQIDAGAGVRLRLPGTGQTVRVDIAHGLRDGRTALTFGTTLSTW